MLLLDLFFLDWPFAPKIVISLEQVEEYMQEALKLATVAAELGEVPVAALLVNESGIVASAHNLMESSKDATCHAEISAIRNASASLQRWRLEDLTLVVTLEPCMMCAGALALARVGEIVFGAYDPIRGALGSRFDLGAQKDIAPFRRVVGGVLETQCREKLSDFFRERRKKTD